MNDPIRRQCMSCGKEFVAPDMDKLQISDEQRELIREAAIMANKQNPPEGGE